ncbi:MAG: efflux RND transporter permease subunit [Nitrospinales bacterium]
MNKDKSFLGFFSGHPTAANLLMITLLFLGLLILKDVKRETFPDFTPSEVEIVVIYPGANAEEVEEAICQRIENALESVGNILEVRSEARENQARIIVEMVEDASLQQFIDDIKTEVEAIDDFPGETERPVIRQLGRTNAVVSIAITGPMSVQDLKVFAEGLKDRILLLKEISQVDLNGFSDHQIQIQISAKKLMQFGLSIYNITDAIKKQNIDLPAGTIETPGADVLIRFSDERHKINDYEDLLVVSQLTGEEVRLGDIAKIVDRFELEEQKILFNGERAAVLSIVKQKREDSLRIISALRQFMEDESQAMPPKVKWAFTNNRTDIVKDRLTMLTKNGIQGLVLVFLTLWLFFSFRLSFWVSMGLPVSFLGALFLMQKVGLSINMLTMVGLLLALGLIMDDAIVIAENVVSHFSMGKTPLQAAIDGTREVAPGVFSSFLTTVAIFGTIPLFLEGEIGKVLWVMPVVLVLTLTISLIEAFCILPNHLYHSLHHYEAKPSSKIRKFIENTLLNTQEKILGRVVDWGVHWRYFFVGLLIMVFFLSIGLVAGGKIKFIGFPEIDGDVLQARILMPQGTPLKTTEKVVKQMLTALDSVNKDMTPLQPNGQPLVQHVTVRFSENIDAYETGPHVATLSVDLLKAEVRNAVLDDISSRWREKVGVIPEVINITYKEPVIGPGGLPIEIRLQGQDLKQLKVASLELQGWLNQYDGVLDLNDDSRPGKPEVQIKMKRGALAKGLDAAMIANQLRAAFYGRTVGEIQVGSESYEVEVKLTDSDQNSISDLELFYITDNSGKSFPLGEVAQLEPARGMARILRIDGLRTVTIQADVNSHIANANEILQQTEKSYLPEFKEKYPEIAYSYQGQQKESKITGKSMSTALMVGLFLVFVLLSFQFRSYIESIVVMTAIPLSLIGVIWGHLVMGLNLSMVSMMGFISLAGVVINDSILLVQVIKRELQNGLDVIEAARKASRLRFRAVLLTSLTTIAGLFPLLLEKSLQAQVLVPLVTSIIFGLLASTILVLIVVPVLFSIIGDLHIVRTEDL